MVLKCPGFGAIAILAFALCKGENSSILTQADKIDDYIKAEMQKRHIPGLSLAIIKSGKVIGAKGYGLANVELNVPATENTVFEIASVTKPITASAIMMLVEAGKLRLDEQISKYLPSAPTAWSKVTVRHLLTHTSGLPSYLNQPTFATLNRSTYSPDVLLKLVSGLPLDFQPGEKHDYCNTNYILLGLIIEKVSGNTYGEFLAENVFRPLGMTSTRLKDLTEIIPNRASGYLWENHTLRNVVHTTLNNAHSTAGLLSTASDLAKWAAALDTEKLLKKSSLEQMWTPAKLNNGSSVPMGFGWGLGETRGHKGVGHGGDILGFSSYIIRLIDDRLTVIVLTNLSRSESDPFTLAERVLIDFLPNVR